MTGAETEAPASNGGDIAPTAKAAAEEGMEVEKLEVDEEKKEVKAEKKEAEAEKEEVEEEKELEAVKKEVEAEKKEIKAEKKDGVNSPPTALELDIIRQIEYYFGDINLPRDKFLQEQLKLEEGWVPLDVLTKFHRLAKLSSDTAAISAAIGKAVSGLMELSEDGKKVRRNPERPLPELNEERRKELSSRTVYVRGFPMDATVDLCLKFFHDYPLVENVIMRRYQDRETKKWNFKGSVFATFKTKEQAEGFLQRKGLKCGETELVTKWQEEYLKEKHEEYSTRKDKKNRQKDRREEKVVEDNIKLPLGAMLHFSVGGTGVLREEIRQTITDAGAEVAYVDFNKGDTEGWVRLLAENAARTLVDKLTDSKMKINESELTLRVLAGDEEKSFLEKTAQEMRNKRANANRNKQLNKQQNNRGRNQGRNAGGGSRKRKQPAHSDEPAAKTKPAE